MCKTKLRLNEPKRFFKSKRVSRLIRVSGSKRTGNIKRLGDLLLPDKIFNGISARVRLFARDDAGEGFIDVLVKMLIVVVVGAVLLAIMRQAIPQVFTDMLTKIRDIFEI